MRTKKIRFLFMVLLGIAISYTLDAMNIGNPPMHNMFFDFLISISITILVWEGNLRIDTLMNRYYPWEKDPRKRILVHLPVSLVFSAFVIYLSMLAFNKWVCQLPEHVKGQFMITSLVIGTLVTLILLSVEIGSQFFSNWKRSLVEVEKYKSESLQAQLHNLKDQLNPHFLFNNLSVLSSLVYKDQDKAVDFINQLGKVYRYLLDNRNCELVTLSDELTFLESYTYLLKIRFDKNIIFQKEIPTEYNSRLIPPMALQMLIENAIKHNEVSVALPLTINIAIKNERLVVTNTLQPRNMSEDSSKSGLQNIKDRYSFFTEQQVEITSNSIFTVSLPILKKDESNNH